MVAKRGWDTLQASLDDERKQGLTGSIAVATRGNPDDAAKVQDLSAKTGVPASALEGNQRDEVQQQFDRNQINYDSLLKEQPRFSNWASFPDNAKVGYDDVGPLTRAGDLLRAIPGGAVEALGRGLRGYGEFETAADKFFAEKIVGDRAPNLKVFLEKGIEWDPTTKAFKKTGGAIAETGAKISPPQERQNLATDILSGVGQIGTQIAVTIVTGGTGGGLFLAGQGADIQAERAEAEGATDEQKRDAVLAGAAVTAATEKVGLGFLMRKLPERAKAAVKKKLVDVFISGGAEALQETIEAIGQNMVAAATYDPDADIFDVNPREPAAAAGAGGLFRGIVLTAAGTRKVRSQKKTAETNKNIMLALGETGQESKLLGRLPERYREWIAEARKDGPIENVYIEAEKLEEYFQSNDIDPADFFQAKPEFGKQFEEAKKLNADVVIPIEDFATYIAPTEHLEGLVDDMRFHVDDVSARQAESLKEPTVDDIEAPDERVFEDIRKKQIAVGTPADVAAKNAAIYGAWFRTMGKKAGIDPFELYERQGLEVRRETPADVKAVAEAETEAFRGIAESLKTMRGMTPKKVAKMEAEAFGPSLTDFVREMGVSDDRGDLAARDIDILKGQLKRDRRQIKMDLVRDTGQELDDVALAAQEAGYFPEVDFSAGERVSRNDLIDAIAADNTAEDRSGRRYSDQNVDPDAVARLENIDELQGILDETGVTLDEGDAAIKTAMKARHREANLNELIDLAREDLGALEDSKQTERREVIDSLQEHLENIGVDLETASNEDIRAALEEESEVSGNVLFQTVQSLIEGHDEQIVAAANAALEDSVDFGIKFDLEEILERDEFEIRDGETASLSGEMITADQAQGRTDFVLEYADLTDKQKEELRSPFDGPPVYYAAASVIPEDEVEFSIEDYDPDSPEDSFLSLRLKDRDETERRLKSEAIESDTVQAVSEGLTHSNHHVRAATFRAILDDMGVDYREAGSTGIASEYVYVPVEFFDTDISEELKVRFADHSRQSGLHEGADFNIHDGNETLAVEAVTGVVEQHIAGLKKAGMDVPEGMAGVLFQEEELPDARRLLGSGTPEGEPDPRQSLSHRARQGDAGTTVDVAQQENFKALFQDKPETPRGSIRFGNGKTIITMLEKSDLSTFLHESGHFFLNGFGELAALEDAPADIQKDYAAILKYLEVESADQIGRDQHEVFARSFEAYLREGKAPSVGLQSAFDRFAAWLVDIYRSALQLNVPINDEIRGVFDRMLATSQEIEEAEAHQNFSMLFDSAAAGEMTPTEYANLQKAGQRAEAAGKSELLKRALIETRRVQQKQWREEQAKVTEEVTEAIDSLQVNRVRNFLRTGVGDVPEAMAGKKLAKRRVDQIMGKDAKRLPVGAVRKEGGVDPDHMAIAFGFDSGSAMLHAMIEQPKRKASIDEEVDRIMKERHGDLLNDGTIQREAMEAVHSDERGRFIAGELKYLSRAAGGDPTPVSLAREYARKAISGKRVVDATQVGLYAAAERRASLAAQKFLGSKNFANAAEEKRKQLVNHYLFIEARKAADEVDKILRMAANYRKKSFRKVVDAEYADQIDALLERFDLRRGVSMKAVGRRASLAEWMNEQEEAGNDVIIDPKLAKEALSQPYLTMTMEELRGLRDALKNIEHLGRLKNTYLRNKERRELDADAAILRDQLQDNVKPPKLAVNTRREGEVFKRGIFDYFGLMKKVQTTVENIDGGERLGPAYNILKRSIDEAQIRVVKRQQEAGERLSEVFKAHYGTGGRIKTLENLTREKTFIPEIGESLSREEMLGVALNQGNEDSQIKFMNGRGWTAEQVDAVLDHLNESDWAFVTDIWNYFEEFWPEISKLERARTGVGPEKVVAQSVETKFGTLDGGYYPLMYDSYLDPKAGALEQQQTLKEMRVGTFAKAQTRRGHTKERVKGVNRPVRIDLGVIPQHLNQVIMDLEMGPAIDSAQKILHHKPAKEALIEHLGLDGWEALDIWMKDVAVNSIIAGDSLSKGLRNLRTALAVGAMGLKLSTSFIQISGLAHSQVELGSKYLGKGLYRFTKSGISKESVTRQVREKSDFMDSRATTFNRDVMDAINAVKGKDIQSKAMKTYFWMIVKMQQMVDMPTWLGGYEKAIDEGKSEVDAIRFADLTVENSQGTGMMTGLSPVERGTTGKNTRLSETVKLFTSFYSYYNTKQGVITRSFQRTDFKNPKEVAGFLVDGIMVFWIEALVGEMMLGRAPDFEDEDETPLGYILGMGFKQMAATLIGGRELASVMEGWSGAPGGTRVVEDLGGAISYIKRTAEDIAEGDELDPVKMTKSVLTILNVLSPVKIPVGQIDVTATAIQKAAEGEEITPFDLIRKGR